MARDVYRTLSFSRTFLKVKSLGWEEALSTTIWETEEPLRRADAVYLLVKVVGSLSQTSTSRSPQVLDLLHETVVEAPRSVIRFTVFDRRNPLFKKLTNRRILLANREIIKDTCTILHNSMYLPSCALQWNSDYDFGCSSFGKGTVGGPSHNRCFWVWHWPNHRPRNPW